MAVTLEELQIKFTAEMGNLNSQLNGVKGQLNGLTATTGKTQSAFAGLAKAGLAMGGALIGAKILSIGKEALNMANDVVESEQLFSVSMGGMADSARAWSESLSSSLGLNSYELRKNVGMLNTMFGSMGLGEQEAYNMATGMTELANDMASFYNLSTDEAFDKLRAGITGETEPLKRLGILVDENTIKQYAMANGMGTLTKKGKQQVFTMTQQQKLQARYGAIMEQTSKAQGDLARTIESPTNQLRKLNAQFDMAKIALGQALQPALIAVLPVLTSFATGLSRVLGGGGIVAGNPFSDVVISLANATSTVKSGVSTLTQETVDKVNALKLDVETALNEYAAAAGATKTAYINITMKPDTTVYERVQKTLRELDAIVGTEASKGLQQDVKVWMDAALQDGKVSPEELKEVREKLNARIKGLLKGAEATKESKLKALAVQLGLGVDVEGGISQEEYETQSAAVVKEYNDAVGVIEAVGIEVSAELGIVGWTMPSLSTDDREAMRASMQSTMDKELAVALQAKATASALFEGTGNVEGVVEGVYANALTLLETKRQQISDLMNNSIDADWDWGKINGLRQEMADIISFITTGITPKGEFNKALFDLQNLSPESLTNFANAYKNTIKTLKDSEQEKLDMRENLLFSLQASGDTLGMQGILDQYGYKSFSDAIADIRNQKATADQRIEEGFLTEAVDKLRPQLDKLFSGDMDYGSALSLADALSGLMGSINVDNLSEAGKAQYEALKTMWDQMEQILVWTQNKDVIDKPDFTKPDQPGGGAIYDDNYNLSSLDVDTPQVNITTPQLSGSSDDGRGGSFGSVAVKVEPAPVSITLDGQTLARLVIKYLPKVEAQVGRTFFSSQGGR
jgi:hypothetical protein